MKNITLVTNPTLSSEPDIHKYYGIFREGGAAFIVGIGEYTKAEFKVIIPDEMTAGNQWLDVRQLSSYMNISEYIKSLLGLGFKVVEFNTSRELFEWILSKSQ